MSRIGAIVFGGAIGFVLACGPAAHAAAPVCFSASKSYTIHPLQGGADTRDGWSVKGDAFSQCVHRAEAADKSLQARYPGTLYALSLAATIGCHEPCS